MGRLRIIAGELKGRRIRVPAESGVRPTPDRVREALFSILGDVVKGARVLDLFAGSGALGLEALSRGAEHVVFVEADPRVATVLEENLAIPDVRERCRVVLATVSTALGPLLGPETFDLILSDPPYDQPERRLLELVVARCRLAPSGMLVVERRASPGGPEAPPTGLHPVRSAEYGDSRLDFYRPDPA